MKKGIMMAFGFFFENCSVIGMFVQFNDSLIIYTTRNMIDIKKIRPCKNGYVDGELEDGSLVEFKTNIPRKFDNLIRQVVAMANTVGGFIILGVDEKTLSVVGIGGDYDSLISDIELSIRKLSLGIYYQITHEVVDDRDVVVLEIIKALSTSYFSRIDTTPTRQIAYRYTGEVQKGFSISREEMRYTKVFRQCI